MFAAFSTLWVSSAHGEPAAQTAAISADCLPSALLEGEADVVQELAAELNLLGVSTRRTASCPVAAANVERGAEGVVVALRDPSGRRTTRTLSNLRIAATWIDSWLHDDLGAPLLASRSLVTTAAVASTAAVSTTALAAPTTVRAAAPRAQGRIFQASIAYEARYPVGADAGRGLHADLCTYVGNLCLGGRLAVASFSNSTLSEFDTTSFTHQSFDALAQLSVPFQAGQATLIPSLGLGASLLQTNRDTAHSCAFPSPDGTCAEFEEAPSSRSSWAAATEVGISASFALSSSVRFELGGSLTARPGGKGKESIAFEDAPPPDTCPDPAFPVCQPDDEGDTPTSITVDVLPGDPAQFWKFFLGLQIEL